MPGNPATVSGLTIENLNELKDRMLEQAGRSHRCAAVAERSRDCASPGWRFAAPLGVAPSGVSLLAGHRFKVRTMHSLAGWQESTLGLPPDRVIRHLLILRPSNAVQRRFDTPAGEASALIRQSQINGGSAFVEA